MVKDNRFFFFDRYNNFLNWDENKADELAIRPNLNKIFNQVNEKSFQIFTLLTLLLKYFMFSYKTDYIFWANICPKNH